MSIQPLSGTYRNYRASIQILGSYRCLCRPACQDVLLLRSNQKPPAIMKVRDYFEYVVLQVRHPAIITGGADLFDFQVNTQGVSPRLHDWVPFNENGSIQEDSLSWRDGEQWRKPSAKDMLFGNRLPTAKNALPRHTLNNPRL
jgi:hypothetical protein